MNNLDINNILNKWPSDLDGHLHYCIGLSGGIDSVVLLHLFSQIAKLKPIKLSAIHVNHGISPNADNWTKFCQELCQALNIPLQVATVKVEKIAGEGLENSARKLRYKQYEEHDSDVIMLAHHQDDQIETMLSQIMRGSNLHNSAGMLAISIKRNKRYWRPLLDISKQQIYSYAKEYQLSNIEDESNQDNHYLRNFIRNDILPQLEHYDVNVKQKLNQSIKEIQTAAALIDALAEIDLASCSENEISLNRNKFCLLPQLRQANVLNYWLKENNLPLPSSRKIIEFRRQINEAQFSKKPTLRITPQKVIMTINDTIAITMLESSKKP